ncbi:unnamed protein product [Schistosoma curassoni]|uniref:DUF4355 domain-containing protein n=1 Tax=Schistosoma curassoni TaxID=6186 RepID=A0A183JBP1_9TREM|nr:unnamed protein product [Schistosoma curassoni]
MAEKVKTLVEYIEADKQVKGSIRANEQKYMEELATTEDEAAREGNIRQLYDITKKPVGKYSKPERSFRDKEGMTITVIQEQMKGWAEHF